MLCTDVPTLRKKGKFGIYAYFMLLFAHRYFGTNYLEFFNYALHAQWIHDVHAPPLVL